ncbi:MAG: DUF305 domain-containing protein [Chloracidobacterium sp.]|nr:DUF305 domain-containing protein [Chloracidobacterium sp.]
MSACGGKAEVAKSDTEIDHSKMDHSKMDHSQMDHSTKTSSENAANAPYDLQFLDTMIAHHQGAVDMAEPCGARAEHAEIKTLCANIITSQRKEIADMKAWREKWFPGAAPAINMEMAGMADSMKGMDMKKLSASSGNDFDLEFIHQMTPHHKGAIVMADEAIRKSSRDEIKKIAKEILAAQQSEIDQMAKWQTAWSNK